MAFFFVSRNGHLWVAPSSHGRGLKVYGGVAGLTPQYISTEIGQHPLLP